MESFRKQFIIRSQLLMYNLFTRWYIYYKVYPGLRDEWVQMKNDPNITMADKNYLNQPPGWVTYKDYVAFDVEMKRVQKALEESRIEFHVDETSGNTTTI